MVALAGLLIAGIAIAVAAAALYAALTKARKDNACKFGTSKVGSSKKTCPKAALTESEAKQLFDDLAAQKHIPFDYPVDCCYSRAHEMCRITERRGIECRKYWLFDKNWGTALPSDNLAPKDGSGKPVKFPDSSGTDRPVRWVYHVAPLVKVRKQDGTVEDRVIDPSIADKPVTKEEWRKIQGDPTGAYGEESGSEAYFQNKRLGIVPGGANEKYYGEDPTGAKANKKMKEHARKRDKALKAKKSKAP